MSQEARSGLYYGTIRHRRRLPPARDFTHSVGLLYLDLDELPAILEHRPFWSATSAALGRFRREDYLGDPAVPLRVAVATEIHRQTGVHHDGPVRLLTTPRTFGRAFNPVSIYYCFTPDGTRVRYVLAEVTNTPWGERHTYLIDANRPASGADVIRQSIDKAFHVSPFMSMDHRYSWSIGVPGDTLSIHIDTTGPDGLAFDATLRLVRRPLTASSLRRMLARFPFQALRTGLYIYAHAGRLKLGGAPVFAHPERTS